MISNKTKKAPPSKDSWLKEAKADKIASKEGILATIQKKQIDLALKHARWMVYSI